MPDKVFHTGEPGLSPVADPWGSGQPTVVGTLWLSGVAGVPTAACDDEASARGQACGTYSRGGESVGTPVAAAASRPVAIAVVILVGAIVDFLPKWTTSGHGDTVGVVHSDHKS